MVQFRRLALCVVFVWLSGCATVTQLPAQLAALPTGESSAPRTLGQTLVINLDTGYQRTLKAQSRWRPIGNLAQGAVFKPVDDVLTTEGDHIHEAYLVMHDGALVGFYLPAKATFSPLKQTMVLPFNP